MLKKFKQYTKTNKPETAEESTPLRAFYKRDPLTSVLLTVFVFFASQLAAGLLITLYPAIKNWTADQGSDWLTTSFIAQFFYILLAEIFAVWLVLKLIKRARVSRAKIGLVKPKWENILYALAGYGVYFIAYLVIIIVASQFSNFINVDQPQELGFDGAAGRQLIIVFASLVILPPIAEEVIFRGFLFSSLRQKLKLRYSVILTSLLFGIAHLQFGNGAPLLWVAALDTFTLSCVLSVMREKSGSLWPSIYLHMLKNGVAFVALFHSKF